MEIRMRVVSSLVVVLLSACATPLPTALWIRSTSINQQISLGQMAERPI